VVPPQVAIPPSSIEGLLAADGERWEHELRTPKTGARILIATNVTGFQHASLLESVLAMALTLRGAEVHLLACDAALPACLKVEPHAIKDPATIVNDGLPHSLCPGCMAVGAAHFGPLGLKQHLFSDFIAPKEREAVRTRCAGLDRAALSALTTPAGDRVGMQGLAGALRYYARAELPDGAQADGVLRRFVEAAILTTSVFERLLQKEHYDVAVFHHGIYVPQGPAGDVLRRSGVRVVNWNPSYRRSTFIFSHGDTYHYTLMDEPPEAWERMSWSGKAEADILDYLKSRAVGTRDWIWFHEKPDHDAAAFSRELGLEESKPIIGMLSNVAWDAQLHYPANAFPNMLDWVFKTIDYFARRPDLQLLLRIHPAEIRGTVPSAQPLLGEIVARYPQLPNNVFVIPPESNISTYAAMALCDSVIVYGTKTGVELTAVGKPVIVAGEAWIRNKGLTHDATSEAAYVELLDRLPFGQPMRGAEIERARKYAYHFFFRRMIPLPFIVPAEGKIYGLDLHTLNCLQNGTFPGLDVVCDGILTGQPFVYEAERLGLHA
jgi:Capsule polysaccharide biosynthesis protein